MSVRIAKVAAIAALAALAAPAAAIARSEVRASAPGSVMLGGFTQQGWPVVLAVSPDSRRIRVAEIGLDMQCSLGHSLSVNDGFAGVAVGPRGGVHVAHSIPSVTTPNLTLTGGSHALSGTLHRRQATFTGSWHLHLDYVLSDGRTDHCDSGQVRFGVAL